MTKDTVKIKRVGGQRILVFQIGPGKPFCQETLSFGVLIQHLRKVGVPWLDVETLMEQFAAEGSALVSFFAEIPPMPDSA